jgi:imidazoleglycerol-phosphate dehydratase
LQPKPAEVAGEPIAVVARNCALFFARRFVSMPAMKVRQANISRHTKETKVSVRLNLDGRGKSRIKTGIPFFDHMLTLFAKHATMDLQLNCAGDLEVDAHHTVEDCGIALGQAFALALGDKRGIRRYGWFAPRPPEGEMLAATPGAEAYVPMDECLARCVIDFSGRPHLVWRGLDTFLQKKISRDEKNQDASSAFRFGLAREFFQGFTNEARCNLHLELLYGDEPHHIVEALFKAFARAADAACARDPRIAGQLPSTKGKL